VAVLEDREFERQVNVPEKLCGLDGLLKVYGSG
jgi:hypothetical protein